MTTIPARALPIAILLALTPPSFAGWLSDPLDNAREIFLATDVNGNNDLDRGERDRLRAAFKIRSDLRILDTNGNGRLEREEIDAMERDGKARKSRDKRGRR